MISPKIICIASLAAQVPLLAQVFTYTGVETFTAQSTLVSWPALSGSYAGTLAIDPVQGTAAFSGSGTIPATGRSYANTIQSVQQVVVTPGQPAHFPFPAVPPVLGSMLFTDSLVVNFTTPSLSYVLSAPQTTPTLVSGNQFSLNGSAQSFLVPVSYAYTITENGVVTSTGVGTYDVKITERNAFLLDVTHYPTGVDLALATAAVEAVPLSDLVFIAPHASWSIAVPEPSTYASIGAAGLLAFGLVSKGRRQLARAKGGTLPA